MPGSAHPGPPARVCLICATVGEIEGALGQGEWRHTEGLLPVAARPGGANLSGAPPPHPGGDRPTDRRLAPAGRVRRLARRPGTPTDGRLDAAGCPTDRQGRNLLARGSGLCLAPGPLPRPRQDALAAPLACRGPQPGPPPCLVRWCSPPSDPRLARCRPLPGGCLTLPDFANSIKLEAHPRQEREIPSAVY